MTICYAKLMLHGPGAAGDTLHLSCLYFYLDSCVRRELPFAVELE